MTAVQQPPADPERTLPGTDDALGPAVHGDSDVYPGHLGTPPALRRRDRQATQGTDVAWEATAPWWAQNAPSTRLHPHQVRRSTPVGRLLKISAAIALVVGAWAAVGSTEIPDVVRVANNGLAFTQTNQALIGGCGPIYQFNDKTAESGVVPEEVDPKGINYQSYETTVPMYGAFWDAPIETDQTFWERADPATLPRPENLLGNQYRGDLVVYYTARASEGDVELLRRVAADARRNDINDLRLRVVPWPEERGRLPEDRKIAFATWGASQTCQTFAPPALGDFRAHAPADQAPGADGSPFPVLDR